MKKIHIGSKVEQEVNKKGIKTKAIARLLKRDRSYVYRLYKRNSLTTAELERLSELLKRNFFEEWVEMPDVSELEAEMADLKTDYEQRIAELERRHLEEKVVWGERLVAALEGGG